MSKRLTLCALAVATPTLVAAQRSDLPRADAVFQQHDEAEILLGRDLFYDPILSGGQDVSCATCHHPKMGTADNLSLGLGDGATGLGVDRVVDADNMPEIRIPRNAPGLFNLGAQEFTVFFHDGRLEEDPTQPNGIRTPLGPEMVVGFDSALSAQSMFPVLSPDEMAGHYAENDVAQAVRQGFLTGENGAWAILSKRVADIPAYRTQFDKVIGPDAPITFPAISNALAAFIADEWRADQSPFDLYLRGEGTLSEAAMRGLDLFYGDAQCADCHSGQFQTDHDFHAIAMPQIGPGKSARFESHARDVGRMRVTGDPADAYAFRTPSLRNVAITPPYGHSGAYSSLRDVVVHHLDPIVGLMSYTIDKATLPTLAGADDTWVLDRNAEIAAIVAANDLAPMTLTDQDVDDLVAFLEALTDDTSLRAGRGVPATVPSGLEVDQ